MKRISEDMIDVAHSYMERWIKEESWCDLAVMLMEGDTEMAADYLCTNAGCIDSKGCYEWAKETEKTIEILAKRFRKLSEKERTKRYDEVFKGCLTISCDDCNNTSFIHSKNEQVYPEVKTECWECKSKNIEVKRWEER